MDPHDSHYVPQPSNPFLQTAPLAPQTAYQHPAEHPDTVPNNAGYNHLSEEEVRTLVLIGLQMMGGEPTASDGFQCRWRVGGVPCGEDFDEFDKLNVHLRNVHDVRGTAARTIDCQWLTATGFCGKSRRRDGMKRHIATHIGLSVPCTECGKSFSRADSMRKHRQDAHPA